MSEEVSEVQPRFAVAPYVPYAKIARLEKELKLLQGFTPKITHHFAKGVYGREAFIPKGTAFVGRIHNQSQINIISKGDISVLTESGLVRMKAPCTLVAFAGAQRAAFAHKDTIWTTILGTECTDPEVIFETLTSATFEEFQQAIGEIFERMETGS